ncbi:hypothetical protein [Raineyella sp.]|uniref:hypothetical protein n=1 Tax=Raineyella sp. TaxID=1911550 RepID=UPI002B1F74E2|nr:hypothetical protein [Raineyella sp.]MEA5153886.1 hypothetical protein [Raineyella sp.]
MTKGVAWAVPAVAVASAAPKIAASPIVTVSQAGSACKLPGNSCAPQWSKGYLQPLRICNNSTVSITVTITTPAYLTFNGVSTQFTPNPASFTLASKGCKDVVLNLNLQDNSQQSSITGALNWSYTSTDGQSGTGTTSINTAQTPPCVNCTV